MRRRFQASDTVLASFLVAALLLVSGAIGTEWRRRSCRPGTIPRQRPGNVLPVLVPALVPALLPMLVVGASYLPYSQLGPIVKRLLLL
ncbi:hypothetical protein [Rhizobium ruizarguesonis]|uniref:hypothetical protein n=1 Tax=Rhizobium ruizarguesonis TaxID=2081791 RepID=UPI00037DB0F8|nr:hypothetical protein [Rhizobium ruizarguesonis]